MCAYTSLRIVAAKGQMTRPTCNSTYSVSNVEVYSFIRNIAKSLLYNEEKHRVQDKVETKEAADELHELPEIDSESSAPSEE
ncbi:hypothetical protein EVAR_30565_1 [Eumeta japonica]|uniref:Uncharacterized protein n=1 Tax=Eumeta variegata TaxID=151549 RepID=A0A4C1VN13_EUMVA|nr:hypothetical protein EVAR_30565_1 [Eumeta japonica]